MRAIELNCVLVLFYLISVSLIAGNTITGTEFLREGENLTSSEQVFELGFFRPGNSQYRYVGIWYKVSARTVVWVLNREKPITTSPGILKISEVGDLVLMDGSNQTIWSTNSSFSRNNGQEDFPVAELLDNGNLVLKSRSGKYLWQSFDHPTDTLLPGMKLGRDLGTGLERYLTSWKNASDPSPGDFSFKMEVKGKPQIFLWERTKKIYRSGPWNGFGFSGVPEMKPNYVFKFEFVANSEEVYYSYFPYNNSPISRLVVNYTGFLERYTWIDNDNIWNLFWSARKDQCDWYKECGNYGICDTNDSPVCGCIDGFEPKFPKEWSLRDGSDGCVRKTKLDCPKGGDDFLKLPSLKLPDTSHSFVNDSMNINECRELCLSNCSCVAYASANMRGGPSGCIMWLDDLIDLRQYSSGGQDVYIRLSSKDIKTQGSLKKMHDNSKKKRKILIITVTTAPTLLLLVLILFLLLRRKKIVAQRKIRTPINSIRRGVNDASDEIVTNGDLDLPIYDLDSIREATNNFSPDNKLGQGGFGRVYRGSLADGREIAVKRLSRKSGQGLNEFINEVSLIAKLQHRNLVRILGCCVDDGEKILVYEYMPNKSLNTFIFDKRRSVLIDWKKRFNIISGIARGLLYLHQDSRFRVVHRDLKASNILLDSETTPKISDFGTARIFGGDETEAETKRVIGTHGYMSPEYAMDGLFSVKSDVFSFGVLVLEIVSGRKNRGFYHPDHKHNLLGHAWKLWREEKGLELIDTAIGSEFSPSEVLRCIHVGLLCVQERPEDRPNMSTVVFMLGNEDIVLPRAKQPGFCTVRGIQDTDSSTSHTVNEVTITDMEGR